MCNSIYIYILNILILLTKRIFISAFVAIKYALKSFKYYTVFINF